MSGSILLTTAIGAASYTWLTVVTHPLSRGVRATTQVWRGDGWRAALPIALAMAAVSAAIPSAALVLLTMANPSVGSYLVDLAGLPLGVIAGACVWCARVAAIGVPRLSRDAEIALALATVALTSDDASLLSRVERQWSRYILETPAPGVYGIEQLRPV